MLSADSRQFYKELSIGTAKPSPEEQAEIRHYFIDSHSVQDEVSSAHYEQEALAVLEQEFTAHNVIVLAGGSGMFIDALCLGLDPIPASDDLRQLLTDSVAEYGLSPLLEELKGADPAYYAIVDKSNPARVIRAIEVIRLTGRPYSEQRTERVATRPFTIHRFVINHPREVLYERINQRVDEMMEAGLLDEVIRVEKYRRLRSLQTVGYRELFEYLDGKCTLDEAVAAIRQNTRRYAKRQLTWFRRHTDAIWLQNTDTQGMLNEIIQYLGALIPGGKT